MASSLLENKMRYASAAIALAAIAAACTPPDQDEYLEVRAPLHLEDQIQHASYRGPGLPQDLPRPVEWQFTQPLSDWTTRRYEGDGPLETELLDDGLRVHLSEVDRVQDALLGLFVVSLPGWNLGDWDRAILRIRTQSRMRYLRLGLNLGEGKTPWGGTPTPYVNVGGGTTLIADGNVQSYSLPLAASWPDWTDPPWNELVLVLRAEEPADLDLISLTLVPKAAVFGDATAGSRTVSLGGSFRRSLYVHAGGRLRFPVQVPKGARLATALGVPAADNEVGFRVSLVDEEGTAENVLEESRITPGEWHQRSVDLSAFAGRKVSLELAADGGAAGDVALWGAPTITTPSHSLAPNIILYVIDGAGADWMSLYGYDRKTTPNLEALASEGVVFERAFSNATWTKLSNPSFLTSLYPTALGYFRSMSDRIPEGVDTLSDHFRRAGYLTSFITSNPVGSVSSNLQEGPDVTTTVVPEFECVSSAALQEQFWAWRDAHPDSPYLVHIQTTDVHEPFKSQPPFAGLFLDEAAREEYFRWDNEIEEFGGWSELEAYPKIGTTKERYAAAQQALYDECMVHQDIQISQLIEGLKARGEWQNTLLLVTADHGYPAGSHRLMEPMELGAPFFHTYATRVPMLVVWAGKIPAGVRLSEPVSLIDLLPTLLELADLPPASRVQGRSLAEALLAGVEPEPRPFFIDMPGTDFDSRKMIGTLEIVDGRWGASLVINSRPYGEVPENRAHHGDALESHYARSEPLVVYDLIGDPFCRRPVNGERPELVDHYRRLLEAQRGQFLELRESLGDAGTTEFDPGTLERLRALGYLQ